MKLKFPKRVWFGFDARGRCKTLGHSTHKRALSSLAFVYAHEKYHRNSVYGPRDYNEMNAMGWIVKPARVVERKKK